MSSDDLLLGFDAREMWLDFSAEWPEERKRSFLLRRDIVKPLSTDTRVWRSVFDVDPTPHRPAWTGPIQQLWENLEALENLVSTAGSQRREPYWLIAITVCSAMPSREERAYWKARTEGILYRPALRAPSWHLLGYDVADGYLLSGLTNLSWDSVSPAEVQDVGEKYLPSLNEYHLFTSVEPAAQFLPLAEEGAREHAPFLSLASG
jgi:hypothetical protein